MDNCTLHHLEHVGRKNDDEVWKEVAVEGYQAGKMRGRGEWRALGQKERDEM